MTAISNLVELLDHASRAPHGAGFWFYSETSGQRAPAPTFVPYLEIAERAAGLSATLMAQGFGAGDRLAFSVPRLDVAISLWFACMRCGIGAVPIREPLTAAELEQHPHFVPKALERSGAQALLVTGRSEGWLRDAAIPVPMFMLDARGECDPGLSLPRIAPDSVALVRVPFNTDSELGAQVLTHAQLLEGASQLSSTFRVTATDSFVSWLPPFDASGLWSLLLPMFVQRSCALIPTRHFVRRPVSWLESIHDVRGSVSFAPAQGYAFCTKRVEPAQLAELDLSSWRLAGAAELSIPNAVRDGFARTFSAAGFKAEAFAASASALIDPSVAPEPDARHALSHGQRALWFLSQISPDSTSYNVPICLRITSTFDSELLRRALQALVTRHDALRSVYPTRAGEPRRELLPAEAALDFRQISAADVDESGLMNRVQREVEQPFDLATGPLFRARLIVRSAEDAVLLLVVHHINFDGRSIMQFGAELWTVYDALSRGATPALAAQEHTYDDFVRWQAQLLAGAEGARLRAYWSEQLRGAPRAIHLRADRPRPTRRSERGGMVAVRLSPETSETLRELAQQRGTTLYTVLLSIFCVLLRSISTDDDLLVATPALGRSVASFRGLIGYFVNSLPIRARLTPELTFTGLIAQLRATVLAALDHQDLPYSLIVEGSQTERHASHLPLCQVMFQLHGFRPDQRLVSMARTYGADSRAKLGQLTTRTVELLRSVAQFELALELNEFAENIAGRLTYSADRFDSASATWLASEFVRLAELLCRDPSSRIHRAPQPPAASQRIPITPHGASVEI